MTFKEYIEGYLKKKFLEMKDPNNPRHQPTEEDWNKMPPEVKQMMLDLFLEMPVLKEMFLLYEKKFTDLAFGTLIKAKIKETLRG